MRCASASRFSYKMCSPNPANWVTFDDEPLFQSPQKLADNQSSSKPNGLKLNLCSVHESSSRSSSTGSTPLSSPVVDFYLSPGPPSNSPLTTPTRDYPGNPCIPKSGIHMLYPIPEWPSNVNPSPSPGICSSLASQKPSSLPLSPSPSDHPGLDHPHSLSYKLELGSDQEIPSDWYPFATVQFVVHDTCASGTEVKSLGIESDLQPQKHVVQKAFYNCQVEIEKKWIRLDGEDPDKAGNCLMQ